MEGKNKAEEFLAWYSRAEPRHHSYLRQHLPFQRKGSKSYISYCHMNAQFYAGIVLLVFMRCEVISVKTAPIVAAPTFPNPIISEEALRSDPDIVVYSFSGIIAPGFSC